MANIPTQIKVEDEALRKDLVDEFTAPGDQRSLLERSRALVHSLFPVLFTVLGSLETIPCKDGEETKNPGRIWLQLKGKRDAVLKAKEYVKGLCEPEMEEKEPYPKEMHCIFAGAKNLFLNRLIMDTSANITVLEIGILSIKGGTEPVVMAQSHIQQFVRLFRSNESLPHDREPEVKRRFKLLVEVHADYFTMDLLLLPSALKEELLSLVSNDCSSLVQDDVDCEIVMVNATIKDQPQSKQDSEQTSKSRCTPVTELTDQLDTVFSGVPETKPSSSCVLQPDRSSTKRRSSENEDRCPKKQFSMECIQIDGPVTKIADTSEVPIIDLLSDTSSMEDSVILLDDADTVSDETEYKILVNFFKTMGYSQGVVEKVIRELGQSEEPLKLLEEIEKESKKGSVILIQPESSSTVVHQVTKNPPVPKNPPITKNPPLPKVESQPQQEVTIEPKVSAGLSNIGPLSKQPSRMTNHIGSVGLTSQRLEAERTASKNISFIPRGTSSPVNGDRAISEKPGPSYLPLVVHHKKPAPVTSSTPSHIVNPTIPAVFVRPALHEPPVTGVQIFLNAIKTPYHLELKNEPGRENLKHIIIDGSNVAMCHGLQRFFSCRGIAIAVEYFWKKGHRKITVFVPQWRTRRDPNITEQFFLQQLEELGLLSFTPARTVLGSRIASHDDRFLLHLAEKTGGVIVTNDNLREFVVESPMWMQIIRERLLQFTFAGDIFMIPDDPLGRHGPKLEDFLCQQSTNRNVPLTPHPADSGVFFPSHDASLPKMVGANVDHLYPRVFPPKETKPQFSLAMQNILRPQAITPPQRSFHETLSLKDSLVKIFPEQREKINQILSAHPYMRDLNALSAMVLD